MRTTNAAKPIGIHLDIEVHSLSGWGGGNQQSWANQWLDLLEQAKKIAGPNIPLTVDFAMQYTSVVQITRNGETKSLADWALDIVDRAVLMAYRDYGTVDDCHLTNHKKCGETDSISHHYNELLTLAESKKTNKNKIYNIQIGVETNKDTLDKINFGLEGEAYMESVLNNLTRQFDHRSSFGGIVVHDLTHATTKSYFIDTSMRPTSSSRVCRSVWVWDTCYITRVGGSCNGSKTPQHLIDLAKDYSISNIVIDSQWFFGIYKSKFKKFVNLAAKNGITVEILFANHSWSLSENHAEVLTLLKQAKKFMKRMKDTPVVSNPKHCVTENKTCFRCNTKDSNCIRCKRFGNKLKGKECKQLFGRNPMECSST